ncbi:arginase/agmatinase/formiminoglutamase [Paenibacillus alvei TS-15]|uniref:Arginase/agmatinase/formiminoglutamase n=1 Tax=Paenibacillus alvei TS-15 TaxID=1117108 RepID=S9SET4_PAEAL|nr:arginase family protein [Paenibacillus alvei]EPY04397.1 arginase/agmatinase/formiminoglutamase [Paenibacillus alvei TS-15]
MRSNIRIIHAPINLGLRKHPDGKERGCGKLPEVLEQIGLHDSIEPHAVIKLSQPVYPAFEQYDDGALHGRLIASFSKTLADEVEKSLESRDFPLVLGGDCSVLIGCALALKRKGRYGLIHLDAHPDYYNKCNKEKAAVAGMDLAIVSGKGTEILTNLENHRPYIRSEDIVSFGYREADPEQEIIQEATTDGIICWSAARIQKLGIEQVADDLSNFVLQAEVEGVWLHLDADILDAAIMPCVDCPESEGLQWDELTILLKRLLSLHKVIGMDVTILDPDLDITLEVTQAFSTLLTKVLRADSNPTP